MLDAAAEAEWTALTFPPAAALLAEVSATKAPTPADLTRWRKLAAPEVVAAAMRIAEGRRKGRDKFTRAAALWLDAKGAEQATAEAVARHKAERFAGAAVVADLCTGVGGDSLALADVAGAVIAIDRDRAMLLRSRYNLGPYGVAARYWPVQMDAARFDPPPDCLVHIDPDRRAIGPRRAKDLAGYVPGLDALRGLMRSAVGGAIKLGPASDFADHFGGPGVEIEVVSLRGECKEATCWFGRLAGAARRRATALPAGATWTDRDGPIGHRAPTVTIGDRVFEPDASLIRAGLVDGFALAYGLGRISEVVDLLAGPRPDLAAAPWLAEFELIEEGPLDRRRLRQRVAALGLGPLDVKVAGLDLDPAALRRDLRPPGPYPATLIAVGGGPARALIARRVAKPG